MRRVFAVVEGPTEESFARIVLQPHLWRFAVHLEPILVTTSREAGGKKHGGGGKSWTRWRRDIRELFLQPAEVRITTMFDLYGLPPDFPGLDEYRHLPDTASRCAALETAMAADLDEDPRLVPYLQRHEFEALVLAALDELEDTLDHPEALAGLLRLRATLADLPPEDINDGPTTAPSKRLAIAIRGYRKTIHGVLSVEAAGLMKLRAACPRFDGWVARLEALGASSDGAVSP